MKNDPIIHAPLSKIVEAIRNKFNERMIDGLKIEHEESDYMDAVTLSEIREALASLGGEGGSKEVTILEIGKWLAKQNYQKEYGEQEYMMYYDVDIPKIVNDAIKHFISPQSERDVLEGFVEWINKTMAPFHFSKEIIDRYLAEKHKTEKNGK